MCGGIVSESLVQALAVEGIELPDTVVQTDVGLQDGRPMVRLQARKRSTT